MANKTFIPAFQASVGDWKYYICQMKYAEVARSVSFAFELGGNKDLASLIQRGLGKRTEDITAYLLNSEHRFLGSLIVATWGGDPEYMELSMQDPDGIMSGLDRQFGVLSLDGSHQFFALDGQHRLKAIKDAIRVNPSLGKEDICVLLVTHHDTVDGRERTQRLFTNINRNAKSTTQAENIALDVDDAFAIITRRLLDQDPFLKVPKRVRVFSKPPNDDGEFTLAAKNIPKTDPAAFTSITVIYDLARELAWDAPASAYEVGTRPSDGELDSLYDDVSVRINELATACGGLKQAFDAGTSARDLRAPKNDEASGHPFMRPVIQLAIARAAKLIVEQEALEWSEVLDRLAKLPWRIGEAPWLAVFNPANNKMVTAKENTELLLELLRATIAPESNAQIQRARKSYKEIIGSNYPVTEQEMAKGVVSR